jgi:hypothetical protein
MRDVRSEVGRWIVVTTALATLLAGCEPEGHVLARPHARVTSADSAPALSPATGPVAFQLGPISHWALVAPPGVSVDFAHTGYLVSVAHTIDDGHSWYIVSSNAGGEDAIGLYDLGADSVLVAFRANDRSIHVERTHDGGRTWLRSDLGTPGRVIGAFFCGSEHVTFELADLSEWTFASDDHERWWRVASCYENAPRR